MNSDVTILEPKYKFGDVELGRPSLRTEAAYSSYLRNADISAASASGLGREELSTIHTRIIRDFTDGEYSWLRTRFMSSFASPLNKAEFLRLWGCQYKAERSAKDWYDAYMSQARKWATSLGPDAMKLIADGARSPWDKELERVFDDPNPLPPA